MRLLSLQDDGRVSLTGDIIEHIPPYAILSHTWGSDDEEVTFDDVSRNTRNQKAGFRKINFCGTQAAAHGLRYFWVDTCCINKANSTELQEAITSMFRWYRDSAQCYVYLSDVCMDDTDTTAWQLAFRQSRWFTRGWTLQELLAPSSVEFFDKNGKRLGDKRLLTNLLHEITGISINALEGRPLSAFSVNERMLWARGRDAKRKEDKAYSLLGLFGVSMSLIYGEGEEHAINRLRKEIRHLEPNADQLSHFIIPLGRNRAFVGREHILDELMEMIPPAADPHDCQRIAIEGLGGVGKTQIALEAIFRLQEKDPSCSVFWVPAVSRATFENGYRNIGQSLKIPGIDGNMADVKTLVKAALSKSCNNWLLIVDNADDTELLFGTVDGYAMCDYLPFSTKGSTLFTTRNHEVVGRLDISPDQSFFIDEMSEDEALKMLRKAIKPKQMEDSDSTRALLEALAYLPLAIKQAAAYMVRTGVSTKKYLDSYRHSDTSRIDFLSRHFEDRGRYRDIANPIATTWLISFSHIEKNYPLAARYLKFICFLAEKDIPRPLLPEDGEETESDEAIGILQGYSFITEREDGESFDIHRLVRLATRNSIGNEFSQYATQVVQQLSRSYPYPKHENRHVWIRYIPHAEAALRTSRTDLDKESNATLLNKVGRSYERLGRYSAADQTDRQTLKLRIEELGLKHPDTLTSMNNLANVLHGLGKYEEAERMHKQTLQLRTEELGPKHPDTLTSMNNLADVLDSLGKYEEAEQMHRQELQLSQEQLGLKHPATLTSMNSLAVVLDSRGKYEEAEQMHRQTLQLRIDELGPKHPDTLTNMNNLAVVLDSRGRYEEAEQIFRQTLQLRTDELGPKHPDTLISMNNLADVLDSLGKYEEAEKMHQQTLQLSIAELGPKHPDTLTSRNNLAGVLNSRGKYEEAEQMHRQTLQLRIEQLGLKHPDTLTNMNNLGVVLDSLGKYEEAEQMYRQTQQLRIEELGLKHPDTLTNMNNLAVVLDSRGRYVEAEQMHRQTLQLRIDELGTKHPHTLISMNNLAGVLRRLGKYAEAEQMHRQELQLSQEQLGLNHPATLISMNNLAVVLNNLGKSEEAKQLHRQTLQLRIDKLGTRHPHTLISMNNLAGVLRRLGKYEEAEQMYRQTLQLRTDEFGPKHPQSLISMTGLARFLYNQGKYEEAEQMHRHTLQLRIAELGARHPDTLANMNNLGVVLDSQGKYEEAEQIFRQTLQLRTDEFGPKHPQSLISMTGLARILYNQGKYEKAEQIYQQALSLKESVLDS